MQINVCVGSACHLKGSYDIIYKLQEIIAERDLKDDIELSAVFCLGNCTKGVSVQIGDNIYSVSRDGVEEFFDSTVVPQLD